jgi:hypothetical protein
MSQIGFEKGAASQVAEKRFLGVLEGAHLQVRRSGLCFCHPERALAREGSAIEFFCSISAVRKTAVQSWASALWYLDFGRFGFMP